MTYEAAPGMPGDGRAVQAAVEPKPPSVSWAEKLMYGGAAVALLSGLMGLFGDQDALREQLREQLEAAGQAADEAAVDAALQIGSVTAIISTVVSVAVWVLMGWLNGKGVGWARIVATILGVLGVVLTVVGLAGSALLPGAATGALPTVLSVVSGLIALAVVILLWRPDASRFFAARKRG